MKEEAVAALNAADEKVMEAFKKENGDILFREVKENDGGKSLVGLHNISEEKLLKALKLGGLANPSAAVIDIARQSHEGYGEISLILPSSMIDKRTGRNAGTFSGDAWTPVYPQIERQFPVTVAGVSGMPFPGCHKRCNRMYAVPGTATWTGATRGVRSLISFYMKEARHPNSGR